MTKQISRGFISRLVVYLVGGILGISSGCQTTQSRGTRHHRVQGLHKAWGLRAHFEACEGGFVLASRLRKGGGIYGLIPFPFFSTMALFKNRPLFCLGFW